MTKIIEVLNVRNTTGRYSKTIATILKLCEAKGKIRKEESGEHYTAFEGLIKDGFIKTANENGFYELTENGRSLIGVYKKFHKMAYRNLKL